MQLKGSSPGILSFHLGADIAAVAAAYYSAVWFRFYSGFGARTVALLNRLLRVPRYETAAGGITFEMFYLENAPRIIGLLAVVIIFAYTVMDLYAGRRLLLRRGLAGDVTRANLYALLFFFAYFYMSRNQFHPRSMFAVIAVFNTCYTVLFRTLAERLLRLLRTRAGLLRCPTVIAGTDEMTAPLAEWIAATEPHGLYVVNRTVVAEKNFDETQLLSLRRILASHDAAMLILAAPRLSMESIMRILEMTEEAGVPVKILSPQLDVIGARTGLRTDRVLGIPLIHFAPSPRSRVYYMVKNAYSVVLAAAALPVLSPLMLLTALAIRCGSRGPALFIQERIGINRIPFRMFKFRTMFQHAEEIQAQVEEFNESGRCLFKIRRDPRITPVGRFLRRFSLDELPQLVNVLRGEMTLVGPRPLPRRDLDHYYEDWHYIRHGGLPGLTCLWQVAGRSELNFHSMCLLDTYYLRNQTFALDIRILARTVWAVLFARGAY